MTDEYEPPRTSLPRLNSVPMTWRNAARCFSLFDMEDAVKSRSIYPAVILASIMSAATVQAQNPEASGSGDQHHPEAHSSHDQFAAGEPGKPENVTHTIEIKTLDSMKYEPSSLTVGRGETVRLIVTNIGRWIHEATIGTVAEQQAHEAEMKTDPHKVHDSPNSVTVDPGETKELIWHFDQPGQFEIGCHIPGHYESGMVAEVTIR